MGNSGKLNAGMSQEDRVLVRIKMIDFNQCLSLSRRCFYDSLLSMNFYPAQLVRCLLTGSLALVAYSGLNAQYKNPADRYANAYKEYKDASCPIKEGDEIQHFVYFARDRGSIQDHALLENERFAGAQIMYAWTHLEPSKGDYDFSSIQADYEYLRSKGKRLFVQLQDATFNPNFKGAPAYLEADEYGGGFVPLLKENGETEGWVAKRWNAAVRDRFALLILALGEAFDGKIEGINLQETAAGGSGEGDPTFSPENYVNTIKANMQTLKSAFPNTTTLQYANFMPGEWLPWEDEGYLKSIYEYGEEIGVGLGAPDLMVKRRGQLNHALAMMHENEYTVPLGIAVQDGNYIGMTGADYPVGEEPESISKELAEKTINQVPLLHAFAKDFLKVQYMFWVNEKPYFETHVLPCFRSD